MSQAKYTPAQLNIRKTAQGMLDGSIHYLDGAIALIDLRHEVEAYENDPDFLPFIAIMSEINSLSVNPPFSDLPKVLTEKYRLEIETSLEWAKSISISQCQALVGRYTT